MPDAARTQLTAHRPFAPLRVPSDRALRAALGLGAVLGTMASARPAIAQDTSPPATREIEPGARVRVSRAGASPQVGTLVALGRDSLLLHRNGRDTIALPLAAVRKLEVSQGRQRRSWRVAAAVGLAAGAAAGVAIGIQTEPAGPPPPPPPPTGACADDPFFAGFLSLFACMLESAVTPKPKPDLKTDTEGSLLVGGALGVVAGLAISMVRKETWRGTSVPNASGRLGIVVPPPHRGPGLGVALSF